MACYLLGSWSAAALVALGARPITEPEAFDFPDGFLCLCVLEHPLFNAALVVRTPDELRAARFEGSAPRTWLLMAKTAAVPLVGTLERLEWGIDWGRP